MKAKRIKNEHCRFCGGSKVALVKTVCCEQWICCDTAALSYRGRGYCQVQHERYSLCYSHHIEGHTGDFADCADCVKCFGLRDYKAFLAESTNYPKYSKPCDEGSAAILRALKNLWVKNWRSSEIEGYLCFKTFWDIFGPNPGKENSSKIAVFGQPTLELIAARSLTN